MKIFSIIALIAVLTSQSAAAQRVIATANPVVYFAPSAGCAGGYWGTTATPVTNCGDDTLGDGSMAHPYVTPQTQIDKFFQTWDFAGQYAPTLNLACAAPPGQFFYPGISISGLMVGQPGGFPPLLPGDGTPAFTLGKYAPVQIIACPGNQFGAFINPGAGGRPSIIGLVVAGGAKVRLSGLSIDTTNALQDNVDIFGGESVLDIDHVVTGSASNNKSRVNFGIFKGSMVINGDLSIAGNAASWIENGQQGTVYWNNNGLLPQMVVHVLGGAFSNGAIYANNGVMTVANVAFKHSTLNASTGQIVDDSATPTVQGTVVVANQNGVIETSHGGGPNTCPASGYFPHNSVTGGAQIVIQDNAVCR